MTLVFVIEPHADDAFLSLGGHIEQWVRRGIFVTIVTVFSGTRKRARDAKSYADAVGVNWVGLGLVEGGVRAPHLNEEVKRFVVSRDFHQTFLLPLGILHPEHKAVRDAFEQVLPRVEGHPNYYLDQPYASKGKNSEEITDLLYNSTGKVLSFLKPHSRKYRHIPLFKDQSKFFHFNPATELKHTIEMIMGAQ